MASGNRPDPSPAVSISPCGFPHSDRRVGAVYIPAAGARR